jgi:hypothetical protein
MPGHLPDGTKVRAALDDEDAARAAVVSLVRAGPRHRRSLSATGDFLLQLKNGEPADPAVFLADGIIRGLRDQPITAAREL